MRTFIRRVIVVVVLTLVLYFAYSAINPTGAEKVKDFFLNINIPFTQSEERTITVKEVLEKEAKKVEKKKEKQPDDSPKTGDQTVLKGTVLPSGDQNPSPETDTDNDTKPIPNTEKPTTGNDQEDMKKVDPRLQVDGELSEDEKKQIEELIYSLIKE